MRLKSIFCLLLANYGLTFIGIYLENLQHKLPTNYPASSLYMRSVLSVPFTTLFLSVVLLIVHKIWKKYFSSNLLENFLSALKVSLVIDVLYLLIILIRFRWIIHS